ncbi:hypothetical protein ACINB_41240 [Acidovorax sp. NB1]|nr:hypothetical protein ACINB_41240 [Acidovorax sp. NB1]
MSTQYTACSRTDHSTPSPSALPSAITQRKALVGVGAEADAPLDGGMGVSSEGRTWVVSGRFFASACRQALDERHLINAN